MYRFRPFREEDRPALRQLVIKNKDFPLKWRNKYVVKNYSSGIHVVTCYNKIVGMVHIGTVNEEEAWLESAYIEPVHRGKGVGTAFAGYQIKQAKIKGINILRVATGYQNKRVQHVMVNKLRFSRPILWYRVKVYSGANYLTTHPFIRQVEPSKLGEYWSYIHRNSEYRRTMGTITSPKDNCWWSSIDYEMLENILSQAQSIAYVNQNNIRGLMLIRRSRGLNFSCPVVLQAYYSNSRVFKQMLRLLLAYNKAVYLSVSKDPTRSLNTLLKEGSAKKYSINRWVVMEKHL